MTEQWGQNDKIVPAGSDFGADDEVDQHGPLRRGWNRMTQSVDLTSKLATGDNKGAAENIAAMDTYQRQNPGSKEGKELSAAWQRGKGISGGIKEVGGEIAKDWREAKGFGAIRSLAGNASAMGAGVLEQIPNMVPPMAGMLAGGAAGSAVAPGVGTAAGAFAGASLGNTTVEAPGMVQDAMQKAGVNPQDQQATEAFIAQNGTDALKKAGIKGSIIGAVDTATMGLGHAILSAPARQAADRAIASLGIDAADKVAVKAAMDSGQVAAKMAADPVYTAARTGAGNVARNVGAASLEPAGEFTGEYVGHGVATGNYDEKDAFLEAVSSVGQGAATFAGQKAYGAVRYPSFGSKDAISDSPPAPGAAGLPPSAAKGREVPPGAAGLPTIDNNAIQEPGQTAPGMGYDPNAVTLDTLPTSGDLPVIHPSAGPLSAAASLLAGPDGVIQAPLPVLDEKALGKTPEGTGKKSQGTEKGQPAPQGQVAGQSTTATGQSQGNVVAPLDQSGLPLVTPAPASSEQPSTSQSPWPQQGQRQPSPSTGDLPQNSGSRPPVASATAPAQEQRPQPSAQAGSAAVDQSKSQSSPSPATTAAAGQETQGAPNQKPSEQASQPPVKAPIVPRETSTTKEKASAPETAEAIQGQTQRPKEPATQGPAPVDARGTADQPAAGSALGAPVQGEQPAPAKVVQSIDPDTGEITFEQSAAEAPPATIDAPANFAATSPLNDNPEPTEAQKKAGNYRKGHVRLAGMDMAIENPAGSTRKGVDKGGKAWENELQHHYGYIKGTIGNDKDHVDAFVKPDTPLDYSGTVYVVDQVHPDTGKFDEHKVMIGFDNPVQARAAYQANYAKGWKGLKAITAMPMDEFKAWVYDGPKNKELAAERAAPAPAKYDSMAAEPKGPYAQWRDANPLQRRGLLRAAGYTDGDQARVLSGTDWNQLTDPVRRALSAQPKPQAAPADDLDAMFDDVLGEELAKDAAKAQPAAAETGETWWKSMTTWGRREALKAAGYGAIKGEVNWNYLPEAAREKLVALIGTPDDPIVKGAMEYVRKPEAPGNEPGWWKESTPADRLRKMKASGFANRTAITPWNRLPAEEQQALNEQWGPKVAPAPQRTATAAVASAAKNTGDALTNAIDGLGALFGGKGRLGSGLSFDEDTYAKAKPLFQAAIANLKDAGGDLREAMRTVIRMVLDKFGADAANNMKPYVVKFMSDVQSGALETQPEKADTATEATNDPTPPTDSPALDQPLDAGQPQDRVPETDPVRGAQQPRDGVGRADDRGVRDERGPAEKRDDGRQDLGDGSGVDAVPDAAPGNVESGGAGLPTRDFRPGPGDLTREGSWFQTAKRNLDLIELAIAIDGEKRQATPEEQALLSKYVGFGAGEIRNNIFPIAGEWHRKQNPGKLIFPDLVRDARWKPLAERAAALPIEWQRTILQSTQYAHYTSEGIIRSIWSAVQRLGFTGGKVFEPGGGIGSFAMLMPDSVHQTSKFTGIEFDAPTALIARLLSPDQNMLHGDFIKRSLPDDFFDVSVGNPPFSQTQILADPRYEKHKFMLHDFFFAKSIDKVRPGGLLAFVTSKGTMDKQTDKARKYLAARADFLGAVRLPSTAFEDNAGTSVVTDVIFLRKRAPGDEPAGKPWNNVKTVQTVDGPVVINEYFADNPGMVLGQNRISGNVDDMGRRINSNGRGGEKYTVVSYDTTAAELDAKFAAAIEQLPTNVYSPLSQDSKTVKRETAKMDFDPKVKREGVVYVGKNGDLLRVEQGVGKVLSEVVKLSAKDKAWLKSYVGLRDLIQEARHAQVTDGNWKAALKKLNTAYDKFVAEHGPVNAFRLQVRKSTDEEGNEVESATRVFLNRRLFREDYDSAMVTSLEVIDEDGNVKKGVFLRDRTIGKPVTREIKTIGDALAVSLDETGHLDLDDVAQRLRITRDEAIDSLGNQIYKTPQGQWQLADEYLSGDVVAKLAEAQEAARLDPSLERNAHALKDVQPEKLGPSQISVKLGAPWVNVDHVNEFSKEIEAGSVTFDPKTESWQVEGGNMRSQRMAGAEFGTADRSPSELLEAILNSRSLKVTKTVDKKTVTDEAATTAANEMAKKIRDKFKSWVWTDSDRAADLVEAYNLRYNNLAPRRFDGSHLTLPGVSLRYKLHPHQLRAIWRQIQTGDTYLAHAVGAGKTIEMIAGGMEQKRLGLIRKPIYVVPNHMLEQFSNEFMELYPLANIMVADDQNFSKERRKAFVAAATLNAPDAIVITHDAFQRIGVKEESVNPIRDEILEDLQDELDAVAKDAGARVRRGQLEQQIEAVNQRFDSILAAGKKDGIVSFEEMGVDFVYVDEAHTYRKLDFHTAQSIKGIDPNGSRRALDMYVKTRWLEKQRPGRAMVFASGTAVTNTMGELYTIMRFFDPETLDAGGISTFDSWARMFGEVGSALEPNAAGKYEIVERFSKFDNVPELMARVRKFMDVLQSDQLGAIVKRPDTEGGKPQMIMVEPTQAVKDYQKYVLEPRLKASREWKPSKDEPNNPDPVIAIITDGRFAGVDPRFTPGGKVLPGETTKIDRAADEIIAEYKATAKNGYVDRDGKAMAIKGGTQIVFYNVGFGANAAASRGFNSRQVFTKRLTDGKIPREQIAWFDDADTDAKKEAIFKGMRNGTYRVLIGSAKKMGTGVNVQNRLTALHYMDPPWYPADVEQPRGRIIRQGNQNAIVREKWYATKGGYDSTMWQMVGRKQRFIDQAFSGDKNLRSMDDLGEASLYEQAAALASGDPRALKLAGLKQDVERLERQQAAHANEQINARHALKQAQWGQEANAKKKVIYEKAQKAIGGGYFTFTAGKVGNATYTKQTEFGQAIKDAFNKNAAAAQQDPGPDVREIGTIGENVAIKMHAEFEWKKVAGTGKNKESVSVRSGAHSLTITAGGYTMDIAGGESFGADVDALGLARKMVNALNGIDADLRRTNANLAEIEIDMNRLRKKIGAPFEHQQEMLEKYGELKELEEELRLEGLASGADRIMLDDKGRGWKIIKGPYKQAGVMLVTAERLDENGQKDTQELRFDSLKDAPAAASPAAQDPLSSIDFDEYARLSVGSRHLGQMGFNGPDTLFARSPYYSALTREVANIPAKSQQAGGWALNIAGLVKAGKVKQDEVNWTGVLDWLRLQEGKVTREQIGAYLDANGVQVQETVLGSTGLNVEGELSVAQNNGGDFWAVWSDVTDSPIGGEYPTREAAEEAMAAMQADAPTKYASYQLPGGTNYREVLLTLPAKTSADPARAEYEAWAQRNGLTPNATMTEQRYERETGSAAPAPRTMSAMQADAAQNFKSSHWDQPNVLAHIRVNDRTDADGKKVLFVEEIQSDWGQSGKKQGFDTKADKAKRAELQAEHNRLQEEAFDLQRGKNYGDLTIEESGRLGKIRGRILQINDEMPTRGTPEAPFVTKTDAWLSLALKRIVKMAADGGYDRVAFVNGEQSAERYDLSKQVRSIVWTGRGNDTEKRVTITPNDGNDIEFMVQPDGAVGAMGRGSIGNEFDGKRLDDVVGKDVAERIMGAPYGDMRGNGLKVGGEGMKAFYDKIVPNTLKDVLKKLGGGTMETVDVMSASSPYPRSFQSRAAAEAYADANLGDHDYTVRGLSESEGTYSVYDEFDHRFVPADKTLTQPGFTLSDAILAKASEDLPQFSRDKGTGVNMQDAKAIVAAVREALPTAPPIHILESINKAPKELKADILKAGAQNDVDAAFHNGEIYVFPNNIASIERMAFVVAHHEIRHYGFRSMLGPKAGPIFLAIHATNANVRAAAAEQVAKGYAKSRVLAVEEALADMPVEDLATLNGFDRLIAALRDWLRSVAANLRRRGFAGLADAIDPKVWTDKDVAALIARAEGVSRGGAARYRTPGTVFAETGDQTKTPAFKKWFGDSKVVDADGKPLVVYHGTGGDFAEFDPERSGSKSKTGAPESTFFFTDAADVANSYTVEYQGDFSTKYVADANVVPTYLSIKKPLKVSAKGESWRDIVYKGEFYDINELAKLAQESGKYDGLIVTKVKDKGRGDVTSKTSTTYIAFKPEQIKSAIGNRGTFDPQNPDIRFARSSGFASAKALSDVTNTLREATRPIGTVSWWDKSIGTQYHKSTKDRDFKRVFDGYVQQTDDTAHYAIEAERLAPSILKRLESIGDAFQGLRQSGKAHMADLQAVSRALFANIEGEEGIKQVRFDDQTLRQSYNLTPKQIEMYHQARAAVDTSVERLAQTYTAQLGEDQGMDINRVKNMDLDDTAAIVKQFIQDSHDEARAAAALRKNVAIEDQDPAMDETRALEKEYSKGKPKAPTEQETAVLLARVDGMVDHARFLQQSGYMPALRFGQFAVTVTDDEGQTLHFEMFESQLAANLAAMKLRKQYPGAAVAKSVMNPEQYAMFKGVSPETVALFAKFTGADQNEAFQNYIALAKSARSVKMRQLKRKGIAGFSEDATRVLASFLTSNARQSAVNMNVGAITDALASKDLARKGDVQREAQKLHEYMGNPIEEARRLRSFMFMHFMGGSIASALVNLTQPIMQTAPYLHQFSGSKTAGIMAASAKMAVTGKIADAELRDAAERAAQDGITEPHEIHQLMADASGASFGGNLRARAAVKLWGSFFATAEAYNRRITFLAAYQVAKQTGQGNAYEFARKAVIETQGLYAKVNRPNWSRGAVGATIFTFKQFSIAYLEWFSRLPPKQKVLAMAILLIAAGADGLPFAEDLQDVIDTIGQSLGYNTNSKKWQRKVLADAFGNDLGEILNTGLLSKSAIDVQGRLGMGNLIPGTEIFKPSESDKTRSVSEIAGPVSGVITAFQKALSNAQRGEIVGMTGAFHELAPVAVKNLLKGIDMAKTGVYKDSRGYKVADADVVDSFIKMLGFQPSNIARNIQKFVDELQDKGMVTMMESMIADRWAQGIAQKDPDQVAAARKALASWNENNPGSRIIIKPQQLNRRVQQMDKTRSERFVKTVPKELRAGVARELAQ